MDQLWDDKQVIDSILMAREIFGSRSTTREKYQAMQKTLGLAYLYCQEEMRPRVEATIWESNMRLPFFELYVWDSEDKS